MAGVEIPVLPSRAVELVPDGEPSRSIPSTGADVLARRVTLGGPLAVPITVASVASDLQLRAFIEQEADRNVYYLLHLAVTFDSASNDPPLHTAAVEVRLLSPDAGQEPIAWAMAPMRGADQRSVRTTWRLGPQLSVLDVGNATLGHVERVDQHLRSDVYVEALRLLRSDPAWRFYARERVPISGAHRLMMVIRTQRDTTTQASVTVQATVRGRGRALVGYRSQPVDQITIDGAL